MIPDDIGQRLHDRATRGETLTIEEREQLQTWYARHDQEELQQLASAPIPRDLTELQTRVLQATAQVVSQAQRIQTLTAENAQLRQEIRTLQRLVSAKPTEQLV